MEDDKVQRILLLLILMAELNNANHNVFIKIVWKSLCIFSFLFWTTKPSFALLVEAILRVNDIK